MHVAFGLVGLPYLATKKSGQAAEPELPGQLVRARP